MDETDLVSLLIIGMFAATALYRITPLHRKSIGYFSLLQVLYLVVFPGVLYVFIFSYMQRILARPLNPVIFISDPVLVNAALLSALFTYGAIAIHTVTKMMKPIIILENSKVLPINRFFHLTLSHNLLYSGGLTTMVSLTLLEINHIPPKLEGSLASIIAKGVMMAAVMLAALRFYTGDKDGIEFYRGKLGDLKMAFLIFWLGAVLLVTAVVKINPQLKQYDLLPPVLVGFAIFSALNTVPVIKKLARSDRKR